MPVKWIGTRFKGVRYYEHPTRKHGVAKDKYFSIRYQRAGKRVEEGIGWSSELDPKDKRHWTAEKAALVLGELKEAAKGLKPGASRLKERRDIEDARKEAKQAEQERIDREAVTFGGFFTDTYLPQANADKKPRSVEREEGLFKTWISPIIGNTPMKSIAPFHLDKLKKTMMDKGQSPRSIEYALAIVRHVFNVAKKAGKYDGDNPTGKIKFPKPDNGRMRFLTRDEADRLLEVLKVRSTDVHDMTLLSLHAGLRFGEIASLTWQDVDTERGILTILDAKAGSRYAFLTTQAAAMLNGRTKGKPSDYVFPKREPEKEGVKKRHNTKLNSVSHTFYRTIDDLKFNDGITDRRQQICFHSLRHSYASWMIDQGVDLFTLQKLLGHKTGTMTQRYSHLAESRLRDAAAALGASLTAGSGTTGQVIDFKAR